MFGTRKTAIAFTLTIASCSNEQAPAHPVAPPAPSETVFTQSAPSTASHIRVGEGIAYLGNAKRATEISAGLQEAGSFLIETVKADSTVPGGFYCTPAKLEVGAHYKDERRLPPNSTCAIQLQARGTTPLLYASVSMNTDKRGQLKPDTISEASAASSDCQASLYNDNVSPWKISYTQETQTFNAEDVENNVQDIQLIDQLALTCVYNAITELQQK